MHWRSRQAPFKVGSSALQGSKPVRRTLHICVSTGNESPVPAPLVLVALAFLGSTLRRTELHILYTLPKPGFRAQGYT